MYLIINTMGKVIDMATTYEQAIKLQTKLLHQGVPTSIEYEEDEGDWEVD